MRCLLFKAPSILVLAFQFFLMRSHLTEPGMGPASSYVGSLANGILAKLGSLDADPLVNSLS